MIVNHSRNGLNFIYDRGIQKRRKFDLPISHFYIEKENFTLAYDAKTRNPSWVLEHLTYQKLKGTAVRTKSKFKRDDEIPAIFRATLEDYKGSGFDRGHMASCRNHISSSKAMSDTFYLSNVSPQNPKFNSGIWAQLEQYVRDLTKTCKDVYVISGGLYVPYEEANGKRFIKYEVIGENNVAVPTHYYKVLSLEYQSGLEKREAFIVPHEDIPPKIPLSHFKVTIDKVEKLAGIRFFIRQE